MTQTAINRHPALPPIIDHTGRGFWCEFCRDYHATFDCPHPGQEELNALESELEDRPDQDELNDLEQEVQRLETKLNNLYSRLESLIDDYANTLPALLTELKELVE